MFTKPICLPALSKSMLVVAVDVRAMMFLRLDGVRRGPAGVRITPAGFGSGQMLGNGVGSGVPIHFSERPERVPLRRLTCTKVSSQRSRSGLPCWMPM